MTEAGAFKTVVNSHTGYPRCIGRQALVFLQKLLPHLAQECHKAEPRVR